MSYMKVLKMRQISLKWFVALAFLSLGILLVVGYTMLSLNYFVNGMDTAIGRNMEKVAQSYLTDQHDGASTGPTWGFACTCPRCTPLSHACARVPPAVLRAPLAPTRAAIERAC